MVRRGCAPVWIAFGADLIWGFVGAAAVALFARAPLATRLGAFENERRHREDWAYEISVLLRNRFLAHEFYDEYYAPILSRREWDRYVLESDFMRRFRRTMFRRLIPNLKKINLLTDRVRKHYDALGLLEYEHEKPATELQARDLLEADEARAEQRLLGTSEDAA